MKFNHTAIVLVNKVTITYCAIWVYYTNNGQGDITLYHFS